MYTDALSLRPFSPTRAIIKDDIPQAVDEVSRSAHLAIEIGFDGVELHGVNG